MNGNSTKFDWLARLGYAARGLTYILLGYLALGTRIKPGEGNSAALEMLREVPFGTLVLYLMTLGLVGYVLFKLGSALGDIQNRGTDARGVARRIGDGASAVGYSVLAYAALQLALGARQGAENGQTQEAARTVLDWSFGEVVIGLVGVGFIAGAFMQAKEAVTGKFMQGVTQEAPRAIEAIGRAGHAARAVVFGLIGWSLIQAAWFASGSRAMGLGDALLSLRENGELYTLVSIGLILFGAFSMVVSRYQIIPEFGPEGLKPSFR
jgi:hypothetical protein